MSRIAAFVVEGTPVPQGSKTGIIAGWKPGQLARPRVAMVESTNLRMNRLKTWRTIITLAAHRAIGRRQPFRGALRLSCEFLFMRPMSHYRKSGTLRKPELKHATGRRLGDLIRAVEDSLTDAGVWVDDSYIIEYGACGKRYCEPALEEVPGVRILIEELR